MRGYQQTKSSIAPCISKFNQSNFRFSRSLLYAETVDLQSPIVYNTYHQQDNSDEYHEQNTDDDGYYHSTTTATSTTTSVRPISTEYNPSTDMGQYCGACRYYSRRLHFKKYCKRDYSKLNSIDR